MIGRCWRVEEDSKNFINDFFDLVKECGMTKEEASARSNKQGSFWCTLLKNSAGQKVATFYMDATTSNAFGSIDTGVHEEICKKAIALGLVADLEAINETVRERTPHVTIFA